MAEIATTGIGFITIELDELTMQPFCVMLKLTLFVPALDQDKLNGPAVFPGVWFAPSTFQLYAADAPALPV